MVLGAGAAWEVSMVDLRETNMNRKVEIDPAGWLFLAIAVVITAVAAMIAYEANDTMVANGPASHVAAR
jgi:uncharacterized membrane protein